MSAVAEAVTPTSALASLADDAIAKARQLDSPVLLTYAEPLTFDPDPVAFAHASSTVMGDGFVWVSPASGAMFAGAGSAFQIAADGPGRFGETTSALRALGHRVVRHDGWRFPLLGGFAFGDRLTESPVWRGFPAARLVAPRALVQIEGGAAQLRVSVQVNSIASAADVAAELSDLLERAREWTQCDAIPELPRSHLSFESNPARSSWEAAVATAVSIIEQGMIDKVVLAREERVHANVPFSPLATLASLGHVDPGAILFAAQAGHDWFIGATPERLVRLERGRVDVSCLAGSIAIGGTPEERAEYARQLLASAKDREEHEIVVRSTMAALEDVCDHVAREPNTPRVVAARSVQHLESPISGALPRAGHVLDLVERLHPTPAVGGFPRERALRILCELEEIERGWYAGPIGWADLDGNGEFSVAIRSALISGSSASLFAGCGIVADSRPAAEFTESRLKMAPMQAALGAT